LSANIVEQAGEPLQNNFPVAVLDGNAAKDVSSISEEVLTVQAIIKSYYE
jgi:hypothetical protein